MVFDASANSVDHKSDDKDIAFYRNHRRTLENAKKVWLIRNHKKDFAGNRCIGNTEFWTYLAKLSNRLVFVKNKIDAVKNPFFF